MMIKTSFYEKVLLVSLLYLTVMFLLRKINRRKTIVQQGDKPVQSNIDELASKIQNWEKFPKNLNVSKHFYVEDLPDDFKTNINNIDGYIREHILKNEPYQYIPEITELYIATKSKEGVNSDKSFENVHTDTPFNYCKTLRFLVCIEGSDNIVLHIIDDNLSRVLQKYDILGFDYANTLHYIENKNYKSTKNIQNRILLKMQYAVNSSCYDLTNKWTKFSRNVYENNKNSMGLSGKFLIISQFVSAYMFYFLVLSYIGIFLYFKQIPRNKKSYHFLRRYLLVPYFMFIVLTGIISLGLQLYIFML